MTKKYCIIAFILALTFLFPIETMAQVMFEHQENTTLTQGVIHKRQMKVTDKGMIDINWLDVSLSEYIRVSEIQSSREFALRESTTNLLNGRNALAGVNGDFFGSGTYSGPLGLSKSDSGFFSGSNNFDGSKQATFLLESGGAFIDYLNFSFKLLIDGKEIIKPWAYNKAFNLDGPIVLTGNAVKTSADVDSRYPEAVKIVADGGKIIRIIPGGQVAEIPFGGFAVIMNKKQYEALNSSVQIGMSAKLEMDNRVSLAKTAISGGGMLLKDGQVVSDNKFAPTGRQPRTALGVSQDGKRVILMVIDGRNHSIGATHEETAQNMLEVGAYNALILDGGGSSTIAGKYPNEQKVSLYNYPSDGSQRAVINAIGVFENAPTGPITGLKLDMADVVLVGGYLPYKAYGVDSYLHEIAISEGVNLSSDGGRFENGRFYTEKAGYITVKANYGAYSAQTRIFADNLTAIEISGELKTGYKDYSALKIVGITSEGYRVTIPADLVSFEPMEGYLKVSVLGLSAYTKLPAKLENKRYNNLNIELTTNQDDSNKPPFGYIFMDQIKGIELWAALDSAAIPVVGTVSDNNGTVYELSFTAGQATEEYLPLTAMIPDKAVFPLVLKSIHLKPDPAKVIGESGSVKIGQMRILVTTAQNVTMPQTERFRDYRKLSSAEGSWDLVIDPNGPISVSGGIDYIKINTSMGSITSSDPNGWQTLRLGLTGQKALVIHMDQAPQKLPKGEYDLVHKFLRERINMGLEVMVVYPGQNGDTVLDGVRYISIGGQVSIKLVGILQYYK